MALQAGPGKGGQPPLPTLPSSRRPDRKLSLSKPAEASVPLRWQAAGAGAAVVRRCNMSWFKGQLLGTSNSRAGQGLQMPVGIPIALGVLALLSLLALACHCLTEAWRSRWRPRCWGWRPSSPGNGLQLISLHRLDEWQLGALVTEPSISKLPSPTTA